MHTCICRRTNPPPYTWWNSVRVPLVAEDHLVLVFVWSHQQSVFLLAQVVRSIKVSNDGQFRFQPLDFRDRRSHEVLVMNWDNWKVKANHLSKLTCPETCKVKKDSRIV